MLMEPVPSTSSGAFVSSSLSQSIKIGISLTGGSKLPLGVCEFAENGWIHNITIRFHRLLRF